MAGWPGGLAAPRVWPVGRVGGPLGGRPQLHQPSLECHVDLAHSQMGTEERRATSASALARQRKYPHADEAVS
eukprot:15449087-Alexandrium_andersonii.AAC.1